MCVGAKAMLGPLGGMIASKPAMLGGLGGLALDKLTSKKKPGTTDTPTMAGGRA